MEKEMNRRSFVTGALALGAAATGGVLVGCSSKPEENATDEAKTPEANANTRTWDREAEVVVVGTGFAGLATAITAADAGASVLVIEKAPEAEEGGNSRACAQAVWSPTEVDACIQYFKEITTDYHMQDISDAMVEAYISEASYNAEWLTDTIGIEMVQADSVEYPTAPAAPDAKTKSMAISTEGLGSAIVWNAVKAAASERAIEFLYETPMTGLVFNEEGEAIGIEAADGSGDLSIAATKGVVLCCGGFEYDKVMNANYLRYPALAWGTPHNTGDVHKICMTHDIAFWHMNSATPATRVGMDIPEISKKYPGISLDLEFARDVGYFWVDKYGERFMDEGREYQHGYGRDAMFYNDGAKMEWPRIPMWQIFDGGGAEEIAGRATSGWLEVVAGVTVSAGLEDEIAAGVVFKGETPEELAQQAGLDPAAFAEVFNRYNEAAQTGQDTEFGREAEKMRVLQPPYYIAQVYPVMVNTNGGPKRNEKAQILKNDGTPIPRLYSSGEFGSIWAWYYQGAGNVSECLAFGRIAGEQVAALDGWKNKE